jgi:hypothetical protein
MGATRDTCRFQFHIPLDNRGIGNDVETRVFGAAHEVVLDKILLAATNDADRLKHAGLLATIDDAVARNPAADAIFQLDPAYQRIEHLALAHRSVPATDQRDAGTVLRSSGTQSLNG